MVSSDRFFVSQIGRRRRNPLTFSLRMGGRFEPTFFVHFEQHVAMAFFLLGHLLEYLGRFRITLRKILREGHIDAAVFLFCGDRNRQHFALGQIGEILHQRSQDCLEWF